MSANDAAVIGARDTSIHQPALDADADVDRVNVIESLCMSCYKDGETRLLLTNIPYFRDVILMSFECPHCGYHSSELQPAAQMQEKGHVLTLNVFAASDAASAQLSRIDLNRQVIKSESARLLLPQLEFEAPANGQRGEINTIEGLLTNVADSLEEGQQMRSTMELVENETIAVDHTTACTAAVAGDANTISVDSILSPNLKPHARIAEIIRFLRSMAAGEHNCVLILDDPAGNSYIENPCAPHSDPRVHATFYTRTAEQARALGYAAEEHKDERVLRQTKARTNQALMMHQLQAVDSTTMDLNQLNDVQVQSQVYLVDPLLKEKIDTFFNVSDRCAVLADVCHQCSSDKSETRMAIVDIPHFKDVILMTTECEQCGFRDTEVKPAGKVSEHGQRITLRLNSVDDLKRDLLKSDTSSICIPEIELDMIAGTLGGKYTTIEGILNDIKSQLQQVNPFSLGDSSRPSGKSMFGQFLDKLEDCINFTAPFTFILDDALGNSFIFSDLGVANDPQMTIERYVRSEEQNEELGLNDIEVEPSHYLDDAGLQEFNAEMARDAREKSTIHDTHDAGDAASAESASKVDNGKMGGNIIEDQ